jgi:hypothetical protein
MAECRGEGISDQRVCAEKGLPRGAFLGKGLIKGIPAGNYTVSKDNKAYAVRAAELLIEGKQKWSIIELWRAVTDDRKSRITARWMSY